MSSALPDAATGVRTEELVAVDGLKMYFRTRATSTRWRRDAAYVHAVDDVSFTIRRGETLGLVGESGSGKSTVGRSILRLYQPTAGSVVFEGTELNGLPAGRLRQLRRRMQMIFQDPHASLDPRMTVQQIVAQPLDIHGLGQRRERSDRVVELLRTVGLDPSTAGRYPHQFSGGQRQRIGIARALAVEPSFIVCDEPVSALDVSIQAQIVNLLRGLQSSLGLTYLFIAHDLGVVRHISDRVAVMYVGKLMELSPSDELYERPLHPYTVALLSAVPVADPKVERNRRRIILAGDIPSPARPPAGCRFHTRCWLRQRLERPAACSTEEPRLREVLPGRQVACHYAEELLAGPLYEATA
jgi:oligopeptide/dipeptide ABC transporter ATP-binding protein